MDTPVDTSEKSGEGKVVPATIGHLATETLGVRIAAFGRVDSLESMDRARAAASELERLQELLPTLSEAELTSFRTGPISAGTYLSSKGHGFAVLTDEILAENFKREIQRRDTARALPLPKAREGFWDGTSKWAFRAVIAAALGAAAKWVMGF